MWIFKNSNRLGFLLWYKAMTPSFFSQWVEYLWCSNSVLVGGAATQNTAQEKLNACKKTAIVIQHHLPFLPPSFQAELKGIQGEQEDLLVLVTDQDSKMAEYRRKLRSYGEDVTDDEDEDDEDGDYGIPDDYDEDLEDLQWQLVFS